MSKNSSSETGAAYCGCVILLVIVNLCIGALTLNYDLWALFGKGPITPWILAGILGLFLGEFTIPIAIILWILVSLCGVHAPLFALK